MPGGPGAIVWKDAAGVLAGLGDRLLTVDAAGLWWPVSVETGQVNGYALNYGPADATYYFTSTDCTGTEYLGGSLPPPRMPFDYGQETVLRVRQDAAALQQIIYRSTRTWAAPACRATLPGGIVAMVLDSSKAPQDPALHFPVLPTNGPLHMERLQ
ncbi:MAG TPA: hypothetical protein VFP50_15440 [Anaeromyxobacteraceae bacterium]|nr:hypothetical protein [Anaeromyxobacteraceae bacterium]